MIWGACCFHSADRSQTTHVLFGSYVTNFPPPSFSHSWEHKLFLHLLHKHLTAAERRRNALTFDCLRAADWPHVTCRYCTCVLTFDPPLSVTLVSSASVAAEQNTSDSPKNTPKLKIHSLTIFVKHHETGKRHFPFFFLPQSYFRIWPPNKEFTEMFFFFNASVAFRSSWGGTDFIFLIAITQAAAHQHAYSKSQR